MAHISPKAPHLTLSNGQSPSRDHRPCMVRLLWPPSCPFLAYCDPATLAFWLSLKIKRQETSVGENVAKLEPW